MPSPLNYPHPISTPLISPYSISTNPPIPYISSTSPLHTSSHPTSASSTPHSTPLHSTSPHILSPHTNSPNPTLLHPTPPYTTPPRPTTPNLTSTHLHPISPSPHLTSLHFRMSFEDFTKEFQKLEICHLGPTLIDGDCDSSTRFKATVCDGGWRKRVNAGGCRNYPCKCSLHTMPPRICSIIYLEDYIMIIFIISFIVKFHNIL